MIVEELVKHSRGAVIQSVEHLPVVQGACSIPKVVLQDCFDVIDTLQESVSFVPNDEVSNQAKGLGSMLSFWERMRNVCPKVNSYNGPILNKEKRQCVTSRDLDEAFFFALCCLGKIPGGAPFSQLHKSGNGSRVDRP